ncbi:unnamed protein product [Sphagnum jensenii]|jgi:chitinase
MKVLPVVVVVVLAFVVQVASDPQQCGAGAADAQCANNLCCSKWGFCGSTDAYCGDGCQSGPCQTQGPEQCGAAAADAQCANNLCCSKWGFCGSTDAYCGDGCQNGPCTTPPPSTPPAPGGLGEILSESLFNSFFPNRNKSFYSYESFIKAAKSFPEFAATGDKDQRKREVAAFCANVCQETSCLLHVTEIEEHTLCEPTRTYCCAEGKKYFGRGPLQLSWSYNYGAASPSVGSDILCNPDKVAEDPVLAFKTAIWFWTTPQSPKPSCHDVMVGRWSPSDNDVALGRKPGFGQTINIINGFYECGPRWGREGQNRVQYYRDFCRALNVSPGEYLECKAATPYRVNLQIKDITAIEGSFDFPCCKKGCSASHRAESWQQI